MEERYLSSFIAGDLSSKMVFLGGPRQVGKTYLSKDILSDKKSDQYYNWDRGEHRRTILQKEWNRNSKLVVFDELHKYRTWKSWLKGIYDTEGNHPSFLITGSARLDVFRRGGDSLLGRYFYYRLHPFSLKELVDYKRYKPDHAIRELWKKGGFPEPLFSNIDFIAERWKKERLERILKEDLLSLESVRQLGQLELLVDLLRERVGSPISYQSLSEDVSVAPQTIKSWIELLERMYVVFLVPTYHRSLSRAIKKQVKVYFYDYSEIEGVGPRWENMIASHLYKEVHFREDTRGEKLGLWTLRDKEKREVDFVITLKNKPIELLEVKYSDDQFSPSLLYYSQKFPGAKSTHVSFQLNSSKSKKKVVGETIQMLSGLDFLLNREV